MTGAGIYCGEIVHGSQEAGESVIGPSELIAFPSPKHAVTEPSSRDPASDSQLNPSPTPPIPLAFCPTEYHLVLVFPDRMQIVCRLNSSVVHEEILDLVRFTFLDLSFHLCC